ncbi:hypothetical protein [Planococcus faecalis]|uniref:hypothetical protein n=1 Tax=Planococcus faecalis TaxID=1598147 RepID=UPI00210A437F|nr:hypothetical protein [Planococcus faecalis]
MKTFRVEFNFDQGNTIVHKVQAVDKESALSKIHPMALTKFLIRKQVIFIALQLI